MATDLQTPFDAAVVIFTKRTGTLAAAVRSVWAQQFHGRVQVVVGVDGPDADREARGHNPSRETVGQHYCEWARNLNGQPRGLQHRVLSRAAKRELGARELGLGRPDRPLAFFF